MFFSSLFFRLVKYFFIGKIQAYQRRNDKNHVAQFSIWIYLLRTLNQVNQRQLVKVRNDILVEFFYFSKWQKRMTYN